MTANDAVKYVAEFVRDTGLPASQAVNEVWKDIAPITNPESLIKFAIACRVAADYRGRGSADDDGLVASSNGKTHHVAVHHTPYQSKHYVVSVEILRDIRYNVNNRVKSIAELNKHDVLTLVDGFRRIEDGTSRHRKVFEYIAERLAALKKTNVEDLAEGEQQKIARMFADLRQFRFPSDLPDLKKALPAVVGGKAG